MSDRMGVYKNLPGVDTLLASPELKPLLSEYGRELVTYAVRSALHQCRIMIQSGDHHPDRSLLLRNIQELAQQHSQRHLRKMYNATGIVIHTNLGRAPFAEEMLTDTFATLQGYNNLELNLKTGERGNRNDHASAILKFLTGAEDILVVNNAAAAVMMILRTFAKNREVIVSRGELIEIGGSFRIPDIMAASDCVMVEVGTTNKTRISDYEQAITPQTALLFKAHKSNYVIKGFTQEVSVKELKALGRRHGIPVLFDMGSGLLKKIDHPAFAGEPDVRDALATGADLVCFSGDKLLGGPQAGIIAGKKQWVEKLKQQPILRALRVCKTTLALLETACSYYLDETQLKSKNLIFKAFYKNVQDIQSSAVHLQDILLKNGITARVVPAVGYCGGGSLPDAEIPGYAVTLQFGKSNKEQSEYAEKMHAALLMLTIPVLALLKRGRIFFHMLTIGPEEIEPVAKAIKQAHAIVLAEKLQKINLKANPAIGHA